MEQKQIERSVLKLSTNAQHKYTALFSVLVQEECLHKERQYLDKHNLVIKSLAKPSNNAPPEIFQVSSHSFGFGGGRTLGNLRRGLGGQEGVWDRHLGPFGSQRFFSINSTTAPAFVWCLRPYTFYPTLHPRNFEDGIIYFFKGESFTFYKQTKWTDKKELLCMKVVMLMLHVSKVTKGDMGGY